ncbi:CocE/NonD family hydrolase C-terminal non-catalytic domain-containing protein [Actinomadura sp. 3N508]|uniref:CocE/NonD family hydrolase C-terminal non-catalytic domain-containing protein n=1 Tax=Actinomadura sp. 3N508 TaxID=3375153 RepID=UPI0037A8A8D9
MVVSPTRVFPQFGQIASMLVVKKSAARQTPNRDLPGLSLLKWASTASVLVLAGIAAVISYKHMYQLVLRYGETSWTAALLPTQVQLMVDVSTNSGWRLWGEATTFDSEPCREPVRLLGPVALHAVLAAEGCSDFDLNARLSIVKADGSVRQLTEGRLRASHRALDEGRSESAPGGEVVLPWHPHEAAEPVPDAPTGDRPPPPTHRDGRAGDGLNVRALAPRMDSRCSLLPEIDWQRDVDQSVE